MLSVICINFGWIYYFVFENVCTYQQQQDVKHLNTHWSEPLLILAPILVADPESSRSVQSVISNNDLLTEILVRLPPLSLVLFKSVSKRWFSLIKETANLAFRCNPDPLSGLFLNKYPSDLKNSASSYHFFVPLDTRIPICRSSLLATKFTFGPEVQTVEILDSCNGLLLCRTLSKKLYVYNPSVSNMFKVLTQPDNDKVTVHYYPNSVFGGKKLAFDPIKSPHYKVIYAGRVGTSVHIHTYSSETGNWSLCRHRFPVYDFASFNDGVYWNDAIYWIDTGKTFFKLDIMNEHSVLTALPTPLTLDGKVHHRYSLFTSRGCLLLVDRHNPPFQCLTIFEKANVYSQWSLKYIVNLDDILAKRLSILENIYCIVLGEREEDSFLVWRSGKKVVQHKIVSKTLSTIYDVGPNDKLYYKCFQFIPSFANV